MTAARKPSAKPEKAPKGKPSKSGRMSRMDRHYPRTLIVAPTENPNGGGGGEKPKMGRPSLYSPKLVEEFLKRLVTRTIDGLVPGVREVCQADDMPSEPTVYRWLGEKPDFRELYARARETQADMMAADVVTISDVEEDAARARNRMDARKWYASKLAPKKYSEKHIIAGDADSPIHTQTAIKITIVDPKAEDAAS